MALQVSSEPVSANSFIQPFDIAQAGPVRPASSKARSFTDAMYLNFGGNGLENLGDVLARLVPDPRAKKALDLFAKTDLARNVGKWELDFPIDPRNGVGHLGNIKEYTFQLKIKMSDLRTTVSQIRSLASLMPASNLEQTIRLLEGLDRAARARGVPVSKIAGNFDLRVMYHPGAGLRLALFLVTEVPLSRKPDGSPGKTSGVLFYSVRAPITNADPGRPGAQAPFRATVGVEVDQTLGKGLWMGLGMVRNHAVENASSAGLARQNGRVGQIVEVDGKERFLAIPNGSLLADAFGGLDKAPATTAPAISAAEFMAAEAKLSPAAQRSLKEAQAALRLVAPQVDTAGSMAHIGGAAAVSAATGNPFYILTAITEAASKGRDDFYAVFREHKVYSSPKQMSELIQGIQRSWTAPTGAGRAGDPASDARAFVSGYLADAYSRAFSDGLIGVYSAYGVMNELLRSRDPAVRTFAENFVRGKIRIPLTGAIVGSGGVATDQRLQFLDRATRIVRDLMPGGRSAFGPDGIPNRAFDFTRALTALEKASPGNFRIAISRLANREGIDFGIPELTAANEQLRRSWIGQGPRGSVEPIDVRGSERMLEIAK